MSHTITSSIRTATIHAPNGVHGVRGDSDSLQRELHPPGAVVYAGPIFYPAQEAFDLLRVFRDWAADAPDESTALVKLTSAPPLPVIPPQWHDKKVVALLAASTAAGDEGEVLVREVRSVAEPIADLLGAMPDYVLQTLLDPLWPKGIYSYCKAVDLARLDDQLIDRLCKIHHAAPGPRCEIHIQHMSRALARIPNGASSFTERTMPFVLHAATGWPDPNMGPQHTHWAREVIATAAKPSTARAYVNFLADTDAARTSYGEETDVRLASPKRQCDPSNVFCLNHNLEPSGENRNQ